MSRRRKGKAPSSGGLGNIDMESVIKSVAAAQMATQHIPALVAQELRKSWKQIPNADPQRSPKSWFHDPLSLQYSLGYKDRRFSLTYETLKRIATQLGIINAIVNTRAAQVASFAQPYKWTKSLGFAIRHKDPDHKMTPAETEFIKELEDFILRCGRSERNPYARVDRDDFENFLRKIIRDSLVLDQTCHPAGTLVELADGSLLPIEEVPVQAKVRTHTGTVKPVIEKKARRYTGRMVNVHSGGLRISATEGHPFLAVTDRWFRLAPSRSKGIKPSWVAASELRDEHYLVYPKPKLPEENHEFDIFVGEQRLYPNIPYHVIADAVGAHPATVRAVLCGYYHKNGPVVSIIKQEADRRGFARTPLDRPSRVELDKGFAELCGLYVAEGSIGRKPNGSPSSVSFTLHADEEDLQELIIAELDRLGVSHTLIDYRCRPENRNAVTIVGNSVDLAVFFADNFGSGSENKCLPHWMLSATKAMKSAFIAGYLSGDGNIKHTTASFGTKSLNLFGGLRVILANLGVYARMCTTEAREWVGDYGIRHNAKHYRAQLSGPGLREILSASSSIYVKVEEPDRIRSAFIQDDEYFYIKINEVSYTDVEDMLVFNMEVEQDHSYIANGVVSHNCFEIIPDQMGLPFEFWAVDAATIRIAADDRYVGVNTSYHDRAGFQPTQPSRFSNLYQGREYGQPLAGNRPVAFVQVINGQIENVYSSSEMAFGVRNPRTDIYIQGYGFGELEQLITIVTAHLYAEEYNRKFFSQGTAPKGILNLKGDNFTPEQLEGFRRQWLAQVSGVENSWKTPIIQSEGLEWVDLAKTNAEMEFGKWIEYLIKITCGVFLIDPAEINFEIHGGQQQTPLFEASQEWKLKASRDRGLKPLLKFLAKLINRHIIDRIDDHFTFEFVGLDELSENEKHEMLVEQISSYMTLNEGRQSVSLPPLPGGDVPMNPVYIQAMTAQNQAAGGGAPGGSPGGAKPPGPKYSENFGHDQQPSTPKAEA